MEVDRHIMSPVSYIYFFYGLNLTANNTKYVNVFRLTLKTTTVLLMLFLVCYTFEFALSSQKSLYKYSFHLKSWIAFISFVKVDREVSKMKNLLLDIAHSLSTKETKKLHLVNIVLSVFWLVMIVTNSGIYSWLSWSDPSIVIREIFWGIYGFGWITVSVLHLTYICFAIFLIERQLLRQLNILQDSDGMTRIQELKLSYHEIADRFIALQKLKQLIDDNFGLLPFLWFFELFSSTCFRLTQIASEKNQNNFRLIIEYFYEFIQLSVVYVLYIICLNYFQTRRPTKNDLIVWLNKCRLFVDKYRNEKVFSRSDPSVVHLDKYLLVEHLLHCYSSDTYMAWNLFPIDVKFIFGFSSSVVTFAVMFIQLNQK